MATITIIGTGLIGCSFGLALRKYGHFVIGFDNSQNNLKLAKEFDAVDATSKSINQSISQSTIVLLATPVDHIFEILPQVLDNLPKDAVVIDTGSTKMAICQRVQNHPRRNAFVASHPMAGSEQSGPSSARANLFEGKTLAICERELSSEDAMSKAMEIFNQVRLKTIFLTPRQHDSTAALVSHLPQILAYAYAGLPEFSDSTSQGWSEMASSGFDSSTRLAASIPEVWLPILSQNKEFVVDALRSLGQTIDLLADSISDSNTIPLRTQMERARKTRAMFESSQRAKSEEIELISLTK
jgi:prephenate dehydrogenase